jgi:serine/threonine-protein kinase
VDRERWDRLQSLFDAAVELLPAERDAYLSSRCSDDPELRVQVESLIAASESGSVGLRDAVLGAAQRLAPELAAGQRVGPWELVREIGHGGMGAVFLARRADGEYEAEVAVKLIGGARTEEHLRRFRAERQILSDLEHPNIARMVGGGTTDEGVPWVAMELVHGIPLDRYCAEHESSVEERLALFLDVCAAVRYAHRHLVVHRDLKPANILVTAEGVPKLLDFGIAKLLAPGATDADETASAMRLLTPAYASPEQLRGTAVTVATDVYGLGVILYQLLAGRLPHDVAGKTLGEIERLICEDEPVRPSAAASSPAGARRLRGDLDTIVMTALQKDPRRRYESVERLADDVHRHLSALPVRARADSRAYRVGRFVRRHRAGVSVSAAGVVLLTAFAIAMGVQARRLAVERDAATVARAKAEQVASFLSSVFEVADPSQSRGETVTARELLDEGARRVDAELAEQPDVQASMMRLIGNTYGTLGLHRQAHPLLERALAAHRRLYGDEHDETATSELALAVSFQDVGDVAAAEPLFRQSLETRRLLYGPADPKVSESLSNLAYLLQTIGDDAGAETMFRDALAQDRTFYPAGDPHVASTMTKLARSLRQQGKLDEAEPLLREALASQRRHLGNAHPDVASTIRNLAALLRDKGALDEADTLFREAIELRRAVLGDVHPEMANTLNSYGLLLQRKGENGRAIEVFTEFIRIMERIYPEPHPSLAAAYNNLASTMREERRYGEAESLYRRSVRVGDQVLPRGHANRAMPRIGLAAVLADQRRFRESEPLLREALTLRRGALEPGHRYIGEALSDLGATLTALGRYGEADTLLVGGYAVLRAAEGEEASRTRRARERLEQLYRLWRRPDRAAAILGAPPP